ncbi:MAG TPA: protealysin inhibitor emfourin, partial [Skermanella sp.]|nr:protealysin inhibitor emfourin [Skermanella sp.]
EADQLPREDASELDGLVTDSGFFERPERVECNSAPGAADYRQYTITIEKGGRCHTLIVSEPIDDPCIRRLVRFLEAQVKAARAKARTTKSGD